MGELESPAGDDAVYAPPGEGADAPPPAADTAPEAAKTPAGEPVPKRSLAVRLTVTIGAAAASLLLERVPLPGIDTDAYTAIAGFAPGATTSIVALGVMPVISAYALLEVLALVVPRWAKLRHAGPAGRARLDRATAITALLLAVFQGYGIAGFLQSMPISGAAKPVLVATLTAGTFLLWALATAVTRHGLGNGLVWLLAFSMVRSSVGKAVARTQTGMLELFGTAAEPRSLLLAVLAAGVVAGATVLALRAAARPPEVTPAGSEPAKGPVTLALPIPASGLAPQILAPSLLALPATLAAFNIPMTSAARLGNLSTMGILTALTLAFSVGLAFLFHAPSRVAALLGRARVDLPSSPARLVGLAMPATMAYLLCLLFATQAGAGLGLTGIPLITAWVLDALAAHRARRAHPELVTVWTDERPFAATLARAVLARRGITLYTVDLAQRTLLQFGAGYAPIRMQVPAADARRAIKYLSAALPDAAPAADRAGESPPEGDKGAKKQGRSGKARKKAAREPVTAMLTSRARGPFLALAGLATGALVLALVAMAPDLAPPAPPTAAELERRRELLQLVLVDDDDDALKDVLTATNVPAGVRFERENAPIGPGRTQPVYYFLAVFQPGETADALEARLQPWLGGLEVPPGTRLALQETTEHDEDTDAWSVVGLRSMLVRTEPILTGADVVIAQAVPVSKDTTLPGWQVMIELTKEGGERFGRATAANVKRRLAILVKGRVMSAPVVQGAITGGHLVITMGAGDVDRQRVEAEQLARTLSGK